MKNSGLAGLPAILLLGSACAALSAVPAVAQPTADTPLDAAVPSELSRIARPTHYAITITPDAQKLTFAGTARIELELFKASDTLTLNAVNLTISSARLVPLAGGKPISLVTKMDPDHQTATFVAGMQMAPGRYRLETSYNGIINTQANGLFALDYPDKRDGKDVRALFTQFEAADARRFAPMFDEPSYKATFDLTAIVPQDEMAVSNMPVAKATNLKNGLKQVSFATTPKMSSYLLFFGLGYFERMAKPAMPGVEAGIIAPSGSGEQSRYALDSLAPLIPYYSDYFGQKFPLPKIDNIAGPGQSQFFGAMENWGAIFTFERILLNDPAITSPRARQRIFGVQAHETAHQWFGDLVTMQWWDDIWLNEGFASWMATKATDHFHPEWDALLDRVGGREAAMGLDSYVTTHPIVQHIRTVEETNQAFDSITYSKGEAVISMLEAYAGEDVWRNGLRTYMAARKFGNAKTADLWAAVEAAGATNLTGIAKDFTNKPGIPLVLVKSADCSNGKTTVVLEQSQFSLDQKDAVAKSPQGWRIPVLVSLAGGKPVRSLMSGDTATVALDGCGTVLVNAGQLGYYRTLYTPSMAADLNKAMATLAPIDQLGLIADQFGLAAGDYEPISVPMNLLTAIPSDANATVAEAAVGRWNRIYETLDDAPDPQAAIGRIAMATWAPRLEALGFQPKLDESVNDANLRSSLISALGNMGDPAVMAEASRLFVNLSTDPHALDGPLKTTWLGIIARNATPADWETLLGLAKSSTSAVERSSYYGLLGAAKDAGLARRALDLALSGDVGATDSAAMISAVAGDHGDMAVNFVLDHLDPVLNLVDSSARGRYLPRLGTGIKDDTTIDRLKKYREGLPADQQNLFKRTFAVLAERAAAKPRMIAGVQQWLASR